MKIIKIARLEFLTKLIYKIRMKLIMFKISFRDFNVKLKGLC